jgi:DNA polymerase-3 subunit delta
MLYALYGLDRLAVRGRRDALLREYAPGGADDMALHRYDGSRCTPDDLTTAVHAVSFFGGRPVVVVDDLMTRFESARRARPSATDDDAEADPDAAAPEAAAPEPAADPPAPTSAKGARRAKAAAAQDTLVGKFARVLLEVPDDVVVILWERGEVRATNPLLQVVKKRGTVEEYKPPRGLALERWITDRARERGVRLQADVPTMLATYVGEDPEVLGEELDKLATYAGPGAIVTDATVRLLTPQLTQSVAFDLIQAMGQRDSARALSLLRQLLANGEKSYAIVGLLGWQVRSLLQVQALAGQRVSPAAMAERLGMKEFAVRKTQESLRFYTPTGLRALHARLLAVDQEIKTSSSDGEASLELLVLEMSKREGAGGRR